MTARRIAWALFALTAVLTPVTTIAYMATVVTGSGEVTFVLSFAAVQLSMAGMGAFVASRLPRHRVGWLLLAIGVGLTLRQSVGAYAEIGNSTSRGPLPADDVAAWLGDWPFIPIVAGGVIFLLHWFPDGRFMSRRWSYVGWASGVIVALVTAAEALRPGYLASIEEVENPFGASGWLASVRDDVESISGGLAVLAFALAVAAMVVRIRRSSGVEREQIKWILTDLALVAIFIGCSAVLPDPWDWTILLLGLGALAAMPIAAAIAILRYRLYDIDVVINRALVYGSLTATLAAVYLGSVLLLQVVLETITGGSGLAVAASTLGTAALFGPLRTRIQAVVDRRFFRHKYDAAQTLQQFGATVRDEVDLDTLTVELRRVVAETMQPAHVSLWVSETGCGAMTGWVRTLAWALCATTISIAIAHVVLAIADPASVDSSSAPGMPGGGVPVAAFEAFVLMMLAVIGAVVASRQPRNTIGWILCVIPMSLGLLILSSHAYWALALHGHGHSPTAEFLAWQASWIWIPAMIPMLTFFPLLFPSGRPPSRRWRPVVWIAAASIPFSFVGEALPSRRFEDYPVDNPFGIGPAAEVAGGVGFILMAAGALASVASLVVRFRRSHGVEREQLKWVTSAAVVFILIFSVPVENFAGDDVGFATLLVGILVISSAVAVAMLRYRLYDIDVVINRALVYGSLTAMLAAVYLGTVLLLQVVLETITGGSGLAVAASTLGTAALFGPLRTRTQAVVDRRFFRRKYDATQTLQRFGAKVRDEVDLDALTAELRAVIAETMQPEHVSLWTRERDAMMSRGVWWGAWSIAAVTCLIAIARLVLVVVDPASSDSSSATNVPGGGVAVAAFEAFVLMTVAIIGAVVASRQPRNAVGWLLGVIPLSLGVLILGSHIYWSLVFHEVGSERAVAMVAWAASWTWVPAVIPAITVFPLLFPTGRPPSPRWRPVVWMAAATVMLMLFTEVVRPGRLQEFPVDNPFGVAAAAGLIVHVTDILWLITTVLALASLVIRFRGAQGDERQQVKWVVMGAVLFVVTFVVGAALERISEDLSFAIMMTGFLLIASGVAVAMLRYRLYDIDVVINRALVYGSLTAVLAGVYLGSVLLLQVALENFTGGSGLAVAASTLGTAALFGPLRARVQGVVDRRFFRRKYDAALTLQRFGARVRDEVDLDALTAELRAVVGDTMQPQHVSLWTRERTS